MTRALPLLLLAAAQAAPDGNEIRPQRLEVVANFNAASVYAHFAGDENGNAAARLEYRAGAAKEFRSGHPLSRTGRGRFAGSIFHLTPDQPLEVRVAFHDPDVPPTETGRANVLTAKTRTRSEEFPGGRGRTWHVGVTGREGNPGTQARPFATLQQAVDSAAPGDTIVIAGTLPPAETVVRRSGKPDAYITLRGAPGEKTYLIGADLRRPGGKPDKDGILRIPRKEPTGLVLCADGRRLYHHRGLPALRDGQFGITSGWWHDAQAGVLHVKGHAGDPKLARGILVGSADYALRFQGCAYWRVEGLNFLAYGSGPGGKCIDVIDSHHIVVRDCSFSAARTMVRIRGQSARWNLIERCKFLDTGIWDWPWRACKGRDVEGAAVSLAGGRGNVVRHNTVSGPFNGVTVSTWGNLKDEALNRDLDIHDNSFSEIGDDPLEPEGACMNVRFWNNATRRTLQGISLAPITVGPVYVIRDRYVDYKGGAVKVSANSTGPVFLYHVLGWALRGEKNAMSASGPWDNMHFRNCILRGTRYVIEDRFDHPLGCSFDHCCLFSTDQRFVKWAGRPYPHLKELGGRKGFGGHILRVEPYEPGPLEKLNPVLIDAGAVIPGVNDGFKGRAPDIGPVETR